MHGLLRAVTVLQAVHVVQPRFVAAPSDSGSSITISEFEPDSHVY